METYWFITILTLCILFFLKAFYTLVFRNSSMQSNLPPGPRYMKGHLLWLGKSFLQLESILIELKQMYGPILTLRIASYTAIFVFNSSIAHRALVQNAAIFSDRPQPLPTNKILSCDQHNISSAGYGSTWRLLRRNLTSGILHPSRLKSYSNARNWVLGILFRRLVSESQVPEVQSPSSGVKVVDHFQYAMFCLLALVCFGDKLDESQIKEIEKMQRDVLVLTLRRFNILNLWPGLGKFVFHRRLKEFMQLCQSREDVLGPFIKARAEKSKHVLKQEDQEVAVAYVDTLLKLKLPNEENRKLTYREISSLCGEFLNAGTDTTSTTLEWIMANLAKYPAIQTKVYHEIVGVVGTSKRPSALSARPEEMVVVEEEYLQRMPYLKAVVLETLRRHPPAHLVLPHSVTQDVELDGYVVPKNAIINFMVAEIGRDPEVWNDPMKFKPERFLNIDGECKTEVGESFDLTGSREIKMMPFGAGRRICPGIGMALLHLEFYVANLVWYLEWKADHVDLSEQQVFTVVMKNPLLAHLSQRT